MSFLTLMIAGLFAWVAFLGGELPSF